MMTRRRQIDVRLESSEEKDEGEEIEIRLEEPVEEEEGIFIAQGRHDATAQYHAAPAIQPCATSISNSRR